MSASLRIGQLLKGKQASYTITQQLFPTVWLASSSSSQKPMIIKSVSNWLVNNERNVLTRFQDRAPSLRQLVDEIDNPNGAPAIVLQHLDSDLLNGGLGRTLSRSNVKLVAKRVLNALAVLHESGYVHTDVKPDNILVNWDPKDSTENNIEEACLSDCATTVTKGSRWARRGDAIGAPLWRSPEATLGIRWSTSTDIWSFGTTLITLLMGNNFFLFKPSQDTPFGHADYTAKILENQCKYFGPRPVPGFNMVDISGVSNEVVAALESTINKLNPEEPNFINDPMVSSKLSITDRLFISKIMKLNPAERPTAKQLLEDEWFNI